MLPTRDPVYWRAMRVVPGMRGGRQVTRLLGVWRVAAVRPIRDEIERRVRTLLDELSAGDFKGRARGEVIQRVVSEVPRSADLCRPERGPPGIAQGLDIEMILGRLRVPSLTSS